MLPDLGLTALLTVGVAAVGTALADRRRGPGVILLTLAAAQLATHVLLSLTADPGAMAPMTPSPVGPLAMLAAHAVAVVLTALLLAGADAVLFRVAAALARLLPRPLVGPPVTVPPPSRCGFADPVDRTLAVLLRLASPRRGPPVPA
jgi:hypothetical protein